MISQGGLLVGHIRRADDLAAKFGRREVEEHLGEPGFRTQKKFFAPVSHISGALESHRSPMWQDEAPQSAAPQRSPKSEVTDVDGLWAPHIQPIDPEAHFDRPEDPEFAEPGWKNHRKMFHPSAEEKPVGATLSPMSLLPPEEPATPGRRHFPHIAGKPALGPQPGRATHTMDGTERWGLVGMESFR